MRALKCDAKTQIARWPFAKPLAVVLATTEIVRRPKLWALLRFARLPPLFTDRWRFGRVKASLTTRCTCTLYVYLYPPTLPHEGDYGGPNGESKMGPSKIKKRSIIVNGHKTSVSLEDEFWDELRGLAAERRVPLTELVNEIDQVPGRNLSSAIRVFLLMRAQRRSRAA